jgi:hypothetical protein
VFCFWEYFLYIRQQPERRKMISGVPVEAELVFEEIRILVDNPVLIEINCGDYAVKLRDIILTLRRF